jgi:hypothetical protein
MAYGKTANQLHIKKKKKKKKKKKHSCYKEWTTFTNMPANHKN